MHASISDRWVVPQRTRLPFLLRLARLLDTVEPLPKTTIYCCKSLLPPSLPLLLFQHCSIFGGAPLHHRLKSFVELCHFGGSRRRLPIISSRRTPPAGTEPSRPQQTSSQQLTPIPSQRSVIRQNAKSSSIGAHTLKSGAGPQAPATRNSSRFTSRRNSSPQTTTRPCAPKCSP